ncbi:MAG: hypothetical protein FWE05_11915 [Defluviitaleaceae bacterium]|nr:hypothetical protein [Defluviitaleaceae bacterium]
MPFGFFKRKQKVSVIVAENENILTAKNDKIHQLLQNTISHRVSTIIPDAKWRWVCSPSYLLEHGGIGRIEIFYGDSQSQYIDVCLTVENGNIKSLTLFKANVEDFEMAASSDVEVDENENAPAIGEEVMHNAPDAQAPTDEEGIEKWFNIVLIGTLSDLINDLNAKGEVCLTIKEDGSTYVENKGIPNKVADFGKLPKKSLWAFIVDKLAENGLFSELQGDEQDELYISWA